MKIYAESKSTMIAGMKEYPTIPDGWCQFRGRLIRLIEVPEYAWSLPIYDIITGAATGETIGDVVSKAIQRNAVAIP